MSFDTEVIAFDGAEFVVRSGTHDIEMTREIFEDLYYTADGWDVPEGATVLDIGSSVGAFAVFAARSGARVVHAYEPMPDSFRLLIRNVEQYPAVRTRKAAVAVTSGEVFMSGFEPMDDGVVNTGTPAISASGTTAKAVSIHDVLTLESVWDVVKLDIEGYEYELIEALSEAELAKVQMLTMEFHHPVESETETRGHQLGAYLAAHGFSDVQVDWAYGQQGRLRARR
jgi:FkbM family methyltransferase